MKKIDFEINIKSSAKKLWQVLWCDMTYRQWSSVFHEGSYAVSDWKQGSKIHFLDPEGKGIYSQIETMRPNEYIAFKHIGEINNFEEQALDEKTNQWSGGLETYELKTTNEGVLLKVGTEAPDEFVDYFNQIFPKALAKLKDLAENPVVICIETTLNCTVEKAWQYWTAPQHIMQWNHASDDWHTTKAENDLQVGGRFTSRMEAKDGSFGFDFGGTYTNIEMYKTIESTLDDQRTLKVCFIAQENACKVVEEFEAEEENSLELQQGGWQMILNNFKKYTETN